MRKILALLAIVAVASTFAAFVDSAPASADSGIESAIISKLNAYRSANGLPTLEVSGELTAKARGWSAQMAANGGISHSSLSSGIQTPWSKLGENVGRTRNGDHASELHNGWVNSPAHNANLLDPGFRLVGVGVFVDAASGFVYATQVFMEPASQPAPSSPQPATGTPSSPRPAPAPAVEPAAPPPPPPPPVRLTLTLERLRNLEAAA